MKLHVNYIAIADSILLDLALHHSEAGGFTLMFVVSGLNFVEV